MSAVAAPPRARGRSGLALLLIAAVVSAAAYAMVGMGLRDRIPRDVVVYAVTITGAFLLAWAAQRWLAPRADPVLLPIAAMLSGLGLAMLYRLLPHRIADQQGIWLLIGLGAFVVTLLLIRDDRQLDRYTYTIGLAGLVLLLLPIVPGLGTEINGARLWISLGPLNFQPGEAAKVLLVVFMASYLNAKKELLAVVTRRLGPLRLPEPRYLGPILVAWGISLAVLFIERDLGSSLLFFGLFLVMLYVATERWADRPDPEKPTTEKNGVTTAIHKFDISNPARTQYRGSGRVSGHLLSQWSLSEHRGVLRVVSTETPAWWGPGRDSESFLTTLRQKDGALVRTGRIGELGKGERVYAVRFVGDVGYVDDEGYLYLTDRQSHMIISGGVNIYPAEIEGQLLLHPAVRDAAVVGVADETWGEVGVAFVVADEARRPAPEELTSFLQDRLAKFKIPRDWVFVDALPRTAYGKVVKAQLRDEYQAARRPTSRT